MQNASLSASQPLIRHILAKYTGQMPPADLVNGPFWHS